MSLEVNMDLLIDLIQQYPSLYDMKDKNYRNNHYKDKCWEVIAQGVNITVEDCKRLWRNLRDRFNKEKRHHSTGPEGSDCNWPYFSRMCFYAKYCLPRKTVVSTTKLGLDRSGSFSDGHLWNGLDQTSFDIGSGLKEEELTSSSIEEPSGPYSSPKAWECEEAEPAPKKIKPDKSIQEYKEVNAPTISNVNDNFGAYVVSRLKEMEPTMAKRKRKTMLVILEEDD